eukprot:NODE_3518_length_1205_cov_49.134011_g3338_i0.p2 GENE.NODE_3518_length_1205_cov_49.134011_g3338_i0~~NODE_3518_length_1205_cov_49.134011_g3338_i0.p2  ORF type:complete len:310 (+),score=77.67 NODE_3518_length_1205_cov_49.134011_g3338_i0:62-991(+)
MASQRKILQLPGIDHSGVEEFETSDHDDEDPSMTARAEVFESPDIEATSVSKAKVLDLLSKDAEFFEGVGERVVDTNEGRGGSISRVQGALTDLTSELEGILTEQTKRRAKATQESTTRVTSSTPTMGLSEGTSASLLEVERRLSQLEAAVGPFSAVAPPLQVVLQRQEDCLALMDTGVVQDLVKKIRALDRDCDKILSKPEVTSSLDLEEMVTVLRRCDSLSEQAPRIVERLLSLKRVHDDAIALSTMANTAEQQSAHTDQLLSDATSAVSALEESMGANMAAVYDNIRKLDARMSALDQKIEQIDAE